LPAVQARSSLQIEADLETFGEARRVQKFLLVATRLRITLCVLGVGGMGDVRLRGDNPSVAFVPARDDSTPRSFRELGLGPLGRG
jgi:hypothetical protein